VYGFEKANLFGDTEQRQLRLFAAQAAGALRLASRQHKDAALMAQLEEALNSRSVIDQGLGILIARHQLTAAEAFDLLRRQSQNSKRKLRDIADDLVTQASGEPPAPGRPFDLS
jgi:AmiR/NasT family two-component response regulator